MTKDKVAELGVPTNLLRCCKHLSYLIPFLLFATVIGSLLNLGYNSDLEFSSVRNNASQRMKTIAVAKDPACRQAVSPITRTNSVIPDYDIEERPTTTREPIVVPEIWKESNLLNISNFRWVLNNESICRVDQKDVNTRLLSVMVYSSPDHFDERAVVRKTWGSLPIYKGWDLRLIFLLGESQKSVQEPDNEEADNPDYSLPDSNIQEKLEEEQAKYGDMVIGGFVDIIRNKPVKHLMGYKWILNFCSNASFVMKVDENKFIDVIQWLDWRNEDLERIKSSGGNDNELDALINKDQVPDLYCGVFSGGKPVRDEGSSYYASVEDWPEEEYFDYCTSWAYGITVDLMKKMYWMSTERKLFWIDNVYFGALLELVKKRFPDEAPVIKNLSDQFANVDKYRSICGSDGTTHIEKESEFGSVADVPSGSMFENDMACLWNKTLHDSNYKFN